MEILFHDKNGNAERVDWDWLSDPAQPTAANNLTDWQKIKSYQNSQTHKLWDHGGHFIIFMETIHCIIQIDLTTMKWNVSCPMSAAAAAPGELRIVGTRQIHVIKSESISSKTLLGQGTIHTAQDAPHCSSCPGPGDNPPSARVLKQLSSAPPHTLPTQPSHPPGPEMWSFGSSDFWLYHIIIHVSWQDSS